MESGHEQTESLRKLPPLGFLLTLSKRYWLSLLLFVGPIAAFVVMGMSKLELEYGSQAVVIFDPRDSALTVVDTQYPEFEHVISNYDAALKDLGFLGRLSERMGYLEGDVSGEEKPWYKVLAVDVIPSDILPESWLLEGEAYRRYSLAMWLATRLEGSSNNFDLQLFLTGTGTSPMEARRLVKASMDLFIEDQLNEYLNKLDFFLDFYQGQLEEERMNLDKLSGVISIYDSEKADVPLRLGRQAKKKLKDQERSKISEIVKKQDEMGRIFESEVDSKLRLESELANLLTKRGPRHPEVVQKKSELDKIRRSGRANRLRGQIDRMLRQLFQLQARMKRAGIPIDSSLQNSGLQGDESLFLASLIQKVKEYQYEKQSIERQLASPDQRHRFRFAVAPSIESRIANKKAILMQGGIGLGLIILTYLLTLWIRDRSNPIAYDSWRVQNLALGHPVLSFSNKVLRYAEPLLSEDLRQLKNQLTDKAEGGASRLTFFQRVRELTSLAQPINKRPILILPIGYRDEGHYLPAAVSSVLGDAGESTLLVDMNPVHPVSDAKDRKNDISDFLAGRCKWGEVKTPRDKMTSFDYARLHPGNLKAIKLNPLRKLFRALNEQYENIVVFGQPAPFFVENQSLAQVADQCFLVVALGSARYEDIRRSLDVIPRKSLQAVVILEA
ncbi:hypothetical protein [Pseudobacteriovorax antillogorgiicola]|uniref:Uncharacterized protein involved in exopolysaccharide biosynthesis n=1 Tax=Pseudobacteriovorax antillogorgiicola TaxID=1513793 RepID=A0A1Y6CHU6_9BACT|nr:hypothetical protein [Pseudobacteriovorax antillogorgiicola]TCS47022.1 uncharacterized protein involved in exopolysaccharide biosynthesis [Pseudobacteriovorax antillogorgiicola]SMF65214.1 Uncharacterized protein involved in exopolysaccharide biosynthesis [Pseudobacteriovorax antillogorgiicola]